MSATTEGVEGSADSNRPTIGGDENGRDIGRYVIYQSRVYNLHEFPQAAPTTGATPTSYQQIVIHDRKWEETFGMESKYTKNNSVVPNNDSFLYELSNDAQYALFASRATNIIDNLTPPGADDPPSGNGTIADIFFRDGGDCVNPSLGACETSVLFDDYDLWAGADTVTQLNADSFNASMSADVSLIAFQTDSTVPIGFLPDILGNTDIFLWRSSGADFELISAAAVAITDVVDGSTTVRNIGLPANANSINPKISSDGSVIVFQSTATNLVGTLVSGSLVYTSTNNKSQIFMATELTNPEGPVIEMISVTPTGAAGNGDSQRPHISADGRFVVFESTSTNLVEGITTTSVRNIFMYDVVMGRTYLVTPGPNPTQPNDDTRTIQGLDANATITHVSPSARRIAFETVATNAINSALTGTLADTNGVQDVFIATNSCPIDADSDGLPDCLDLCPVDASKSAPGQCGCAVADTDTDADGTANCNDQCPADPNKTAPDDCGCGQTETDGDGDGVANCIDECPTDSTKGEEGECGCGIADTDANGNDVADCNDPATTLRPTSPRAIALPPAEGSTTDRIRLVARNLFTNVIYQFEIRQLTDANGNSITPVTIRVNSDRPQITRSNLVGGARYAVRVRLKAGTDNFTQFSPRTRFRVGTTE